MCLPPTGARRVLRGMPVQLLHAPRQPPATIPWSASTLRSPSPTSRTTAGGRLPGTSRSALLERSVPSTRARQGSAYSSGLGSTGLSLEGGEHAARFELPKGLQASLTVGLEDLRRTRC